MFPTLKIPVYLFLFLFSNVAEAQVAGNFQYGQPGNEPFDRSAATSATPLKDESFVQANGLMNVVADEYVALFNVAQVGEEMAEADSLLGLRIALFKKVLQRSGIDTQQVGVDMISFVPRYELQVERKRFSKSYNEVPAGFELQKNISVPYKTAAMLDRIIAAGANAEIYDLVKVDYGFSSLEQCLDTLRHACTQVLRKRLKSYETLGVRLDTLQKTIAEHHRVVYPPSRYATYQAFSRASFNAATRRPVELNTADKTTSRYYSPVAYDHYDLVINPLIKEPMIQISYSLSLRYEQRQLPVSHNQITPSLEVRRID